MGIVDLLVTEVQWLTVPALQEQIKATVAGVRLWLLVGDAVPDEHHEMFTGVTGRVLPWAGHRLLGPWWCEAATDVAPGGAAPGPAAPSCDR
jgi:hypothetical protein